jgi:hypothetical protein
MAMAGNKRASRPVLIIIAVAVILLAFYIGVNRSLGGKMEEAAAAFTKGVPNGGDYGSSISRQLKARIDACNNMQPIAAKYEAVLQEYSALRFARNELYDLWLEGRDLHAMYEADQRLSEKFSALYDRLYPLATPKQRGEMDGIKAVMDNARREIEERPYNDYIAEFYKNVLDRFPASVLRRLCRAEPPQYFR